MGTLVQLLGALMATAAAALITGSWVPLLVAGVVLVVVPEAPTVLAASRFIREKRKIRRRYLQAVAEKRAAG